MTINLNSRKLLRQAKKQRRFEAKREKYRNKNRLPKYIICFAFAGIGLANAAICLTILFQYYADFKYQTSLSYLDLPAVSEPCYIKVEIVYQHNPPENIKLTNGTNNIPTSELEITNDTSTKTMTIGLDTDVKSNEYRLTVQPGDNFELKYRTAVEPSYKYLICGAQPYTSQTGDLWVDLTTSFRRLPKHVQCIIKGRGQQYAPIVFEAAIPQNVRYSLNLSEIARQKGFKLDKCDALRVNFRINVEDTELEVPSVDVELILAEWPTYNSSEQHQYSMNNTNAYLTR